MATIVETRTWRESLSDYWRLIKFPQTALLLVTGLSAYMLSAGPSWDPWQGLGLAAVLLLSVSGCTILNMVLDREIDVQMERTAARPLARRSILPLEAGLLGGTLSALGIGLALLLDWRLGAIVVVGFLFNLLVYTLWLKRRTPFSILVGGVAGALPALGGRMLAIGRIDGLGLLLAGSVLLWIPAHNLTLATHYAAEYRRAGIPTWPNVYGQRASRILVAATIVLYTLVLLACAALLQVHLAILAILAGLSAGMLALAMVQIIRPSRPRNWLLFKAASFFMLAWSLLLIVEAVV